jgi:hypothetical protein
VAADVWSLESHIDSLRRDTRHALRGLIHKPGYTLAVVLTLALGIGANAVVFALVNAIGATEHRVVAAELRGLTSSSEGHDPSAQSSTRYAPRWNSGPRSGRPNCALSRRWRGCCCGVSVAR